MEQLKNHFNRSTRQNPNLSSLICFNMTMKTRKYKESDIEKMFTKLVEKGDYPRSYKNTLIEQATNLNTAK